MNKIEIGTSGFYYRSNKFYPKNLNEHKLVYYSKFFNTVEINSTFYKLPTIKTFENWYKTTPKDFLFTIKLSKEITHINKLKINKITQPLIMQFLESVSGLKSKLRIILIQLPKSFKFDQIILETFLAYFFSQLKIKNKKCKLVIEFRDERSFNSECYEILKKYKIGLVINDSPYFPKVKKFTANFTYIRMHGPLSLYTSNYSHLQLNKLKSEIDSFPKNLKQIFIYFNNDYNGFATENAQYLNKKFI